MRQRKVATFLLPMIAFLFCGCAQRQAINLNTLNPEEININDSTQTQDPSENGETPAEDNQNNNTNENENTNTESPPEIDPEEEEEIPPAPPQLSELPEEYENNEKLNFSLGEDGEAHHYDNSKKVTEYFEEQLSIVNAEYIFPKSRDMVGNGCLKVGSTRNDGHFDIDLSTVTNVYKVAMYVANYKTDATGATMSVNGSEYVQVGGQSNTGEYSLFIFDNNENYLLSFSFIKRVMINEIVFILN